MTPNTSKSPPKPETIDNNENLEGYHAETPENTRFNK